MDLGVPLPFGVVLQAAIQNRMMKCMTKNLLISLMMSLAIRGTAFAADPAGVLKKPVPDKIVVLTFDDGPLSGYTVVAPILKSLGFNGSSWAMAAGERP